MTSNKWHRTGKRVGKRSAAGRTLRVEQLEGRQLLAADMVLQWNSATIDAIRSDPAAGDPGHASRVFAMVQGAVFDAVNAITKDYTNFALTEEAPNWASKEAAVATAARDTLAGIFPNQATKFDVWWQQSLATIPDGAVEDAGVAIGHSAAAAMLSMRVDDGSAEGNFYQTTPGPGHWQVDPLHPDQIAWGPEWGSVTPFGMRYTSDFQAPPPPDLTSQEYADAYNEVKSLGALNSTTRTADQTEIGIFWGYDTAIMGSPIVHYNQDAQIISDLKGNSLEENARLFALMNVAMADAGMAIWQSKFDYDFWRPVTAIRAGNTDGNPLTQADPNWIPLGAPGTDPNSSTDNFTPPFPSYVSGHSGFGSAAFRTLALFYGSDQFNFTLKSDELPGVTRSYTSFSQAAEENGLSRIYLGIHWNFDNIQAQVLGNGIADDVYSNMLVPRDTSTIVEIQRVGGGFRALTLPQGTRVTLRVEGDTLTFIRQDTNEVIFEENSSEVAAIRFDGRNEATDFLDIRLIDGATMPDSIIFEFVGNQEWFDGVGLTTGAGNDTIELNNNQLVAVGATPIIYLYGYGYVDLNAKGGDDVLKVTGVQQWQQIDLDGGYGDDRLSIWSKNANIYASDPGGYDWLDYSWVFSSAYVDLAQSNGEFQYTGSNNLRLWGDIEALLGSNNDDRLFGNGLANFIDGQSGNDVIYGRGGDDTLVGNWGNDLVYGNDGNDQLWTGQGDDVGLGGSGNDVLHGGDGRDVLIGGYGADYLIGEAGDDLLIGGATAFDGNEAALWAILAEWTSSRTRTQRQLNLLYGTGSATRLNQSYFLQTGAGGTIYDDAAVDVLIKGPDDAWTFQQGGDQVRNS